VNAKKAADRGRGGTSGDISIVGPQSASERGNPKVLRRARGAKVMMRAVLLPFMHPSAVLPGDLALNLHAKA